MHTGFINTDHLVHLLDDVYRLLKNHKQATAEAHVLKPSEKRQHERRLKQQLGRLHAADIAHILEGMVLEDRLYIWSQIPTGRRGEILINLSDAVRETLIDEMEEREIVSAASSLEGDEIAALVQNLPESAVDTILQSMSPEEKRRFDETLSFPDGTVGSLMDFSMITVREENSIKGVLRYCRALGQLPEHSDQIFVVDRDDVLKGCLPLDELVTMPFEQKVGEQMRLNGVTFKTGDQAQDAANAFHRYELISAPVVDDDGKLIGRLCVDDILDFIRESSEEQALYQMGFLEGEDRLSGTWKGARNRWLWLAINIGLAFVATRVITLFEGTIAELVVLAVLMPIVAATGGNIGNQTCTLIIRSLALGQVSMNNIHQFYLKEMGISVINGLIWGGAAGLFVAYIYDSPGMGLVMMAALFLNLVTAAFVGLTIPLIRKRFHLDPAIGAHVLVTFFADSFGFLVFLGLAALFLI